MIIRLKTKGIYHLFPEKLTASKTGMTNNAKKYVGLPHKSKIKYYEKNQAFWIFNATVCSCCK